MENLGYDHPLGNEMLRKTIAAHVQQYKQIEADSSSILITSGAQQALNLIVQCLLKPAMRSRLKILRIVFRFQCLNRPV